MKYRVYNDQNIMRAGSPMAGHIFATYFKTKREAIAHAEKIGGNVRIERKVCTSWVTC